MQLTLFSRPRYMIRSATAADQIPTSGKPAGRSHTSVLERYNDLAVDDLAGDRRSYEAEPGVQQPQAHLWTGTAPAWTGRSSQL